MTLGCGPETLAKIVEWNTVKVNGKDSPYHIEYVPVYMSCKGCGDAISSTEANLADVLWDKYRRKDSKIGNDEIIVSVTDGGSNKNYKPPYPDDETNKLLT